MNTQQEGTQTWQPSSTVLVLGGLVVALASAFLGMAWSELYVLVIVGTAIALVGVVLNAATRRPTASDLGVREMAAFIVVLAVWFALCGLDVVPARLTGAGVPLAVLAVLLCRSFGSRKRT